MKVRPFALSVLSAPVLFMLVVGYAALFTLVSDVAFANGYNRDCNCNRPVVRQYAPRPDYGRRPTYDGRGHQTNWMQSQGFTSCSQVRASCYRGASKPGHGLAYGGVCEDRFNVCMRTGTWSTNNTGSVGGLARR